MADIGQDVQLKERFLGFDAREMWLDFDAGWPQERKDIYLLRHDVLKVLSTDSMAWQSVFELDENLPRPPAWEAFDWWVDLQKIKMELASEWDSAHRRYWLVDRQLFRYCLGFWTQFCRQLLRVLSWLENQS